MNRFDKDFHDSDPITGRPFSSGYPDGIWIIGIIISLFLIATILGTGIASVATWKEGKGILAAGRVVFVGLIPIYMWGLFLYLLVKRSAGIIAFSAILGALSFASGIYVHMNNGSGLTGSIIVCLLFLYFAFYGEGLREDGLIGNIDEQKKSVVTNRETKPPRS